MREEYEAWQDATEGSITFAPRERIAALRTQGQLHDARLLHTIAADTWEEAMAVHHVKMGFEPHKPGKPVQCPKGCGSIYYPEGSGVCPKCGEIG